MTVQATEIRQRATLRGEVYLKAKSVTLIRCEHCDSLFKPHRANQRFCTKTCSRDSKRQVLESRHCDFCNQGYVPKRASSRFCSDACRVNDWRQPEHLRHEAWAAEKSAGESMEFDSRTMHTTSDWTGPLGTFEKRVESYLQRSLNAVNE